MTDRDCANCKHHTEDGCSSWDCEYKPKDLISRADAIEAVHKYFVDKINNEPHEIDEDGDDVFTDMKSVNALFHHNKMVSKAIKALPSADAEPIVIRSKTLMPTKDFKEWAKRVRETNPNAVVIPCDAEVISADAVHKPDYSYEADMVRRLKESRSADAVPPSLADVYKWERDIALSQLEEYGIGFAEKKRDDLVEVVRCKDCKHRPYLKNENWSDYGFNVIGDETCPCVNNDDGWYSWMPKDNFYCGFGERKGGENE